MNRRPQANAGFSLIEVMCALLVLGIGIVGLTQGVTTALSSSKESEIQTIAALFAAGQIELLRADGFLIEETSEGECGEQLPSYRWKRTVTATGIDGLYDVDVEVSQAPSGRTIYELKTLLFDPPFVSTPSEREKEKTENSSRSRKKERRRR